MARDTIHGSQAGAGSQAQPGSQQGLTQGQGQAQASGQGAPQQPQQPLSSLYKYRYVGGFQEDHKAPIFCVTFNNFDPAHGDVFATVGQQRASIYRQLPGGQFELLQVFEDGDRGRKRGSAAGAGAAEADGADGGGGASGGAGAITENGEYFYCCKWSRDEESGAALLLVAGKKALVRVLDVSRGGLVHTFTGHGKEINDIAVHPNRPHLFLTASDDESIRLWNIKSRTCVAIFAGEGGHRNKVLTLDFHPWDGHRFLSAGMDNSVKIWSLGPIERLIEESERAQDGFVGAGAGAGSKLRSFPTRVVQQPLFSTMQVHDDYVDCVRWYGDLVLSKSVHDVITLWKPHGQSNHRRPPPLGEEAVASAAGGGGAAAGDDDSDVDGDVGLSASGGESVPSRATRILDFSLSDSLRTWFVRFSCDVNFSALACGNARGKVFVFSPLAPTPAPRARLSAPQCKAVVRQTAVSWDGSTILASCEDGSVHRWDRENGESAMDLDV
ncbi:hypothetical protein PLESTB_001786700 [Pleodorina starrii]|uniref:Uncharacterized protein n=1 Tax=Pleodorina starrii TaxID=330485 RepID=A0A9W6F9S8_9CHLO|nr:hypothetical protein PLESTM_001757500 [Pleodorina starrii]GLC61649.1 hypothetical protein PLESTB_001786700 [Pleodorina starrii]GLC76528.1 hypothetical protein PLESTF_001793000 [Pleodorina starrii]